MTYTIRDKTSEKSFTLEGKSIIELELKLNLSDYGNEWKDIGDHLFNYYHKSGDSKDDLLLVNSQQYDELLELSKINYNHMLSKKYNM